MTAYHLQARRKVCDRSGRHREETRLTDAADLDTAVRSAHEQAADGFTVWIFHRTVRSGLTTTPHPLHLVTTIGPTEDDRPHPAPMPSRPGVTRPAGRRPA